MSYKEKLLGIVEKFERQSVILAGDIMLDVSETQRMTKLSDEGFAPVLTNPNVTYALGGAGNVFANILSLDGHAYLFGVVGYDEFGRKIHGLGNSMDCKFGEIEGISMAEGRKTTIKRRTILDGGHYKNLLNIVSWEDTYDIDNKLVNNLLDILKQKLTLKGNVHVIAFSDYAKGFLTPYLVQQFRELIEEKDVLTIVDPKPKAHMLNRLDKFKGCYGFKPNLKESETMSGIRSNSDLSNISDIGRKCVDILKPKGFLLITCGENGMYLFYPNSELIDHTPPHKVEVSDITGAGDTVLSALSLSLSAGASAYDSAMIANLAASEKVKKRGTATVSKKELTDFIKRANISF